MKELARKIGSNLVTQAILSILLGLFLLIWPQATVVTLIYILGAYLALSGVIALVTYFRHRKRYGGSEGTLVAGILFIIAALICFIFTRQVASLFTLIFGILIALSGILNMVRTVELRRSFGGIWVLFMIISLLIAIGGIVIIFYPFQSTVFFILVLGIILIVKGVIELIMRIYLRGIERGRR